MTPFILLPVKSLNHGKSRLATALSDADRTAFNRRLLEHVLTVAISSVGAARTVVVSGDSAALALARARGAIPVTESEMAGLNPALTVAAGEAARRGAEAVLALPVDLPLVEEADIEALFAVARSPRTVAIAPDRHGTGTNALLVSPPGAIPFAFGRNSFGAHLAAARRAGIEPVVLRRDAVAFDIDTADDLARLGHHHPGWRDGPFCGGMDGSQHRIQRNRR